VLIVTEAYPIAYRQHHGSFACLVDPGERLEVEVVHSDGSVAWRAIDTPVTCYKEMLTRYLRKEGESGAV
jgi:hypothetical protein